VELEHEPHRSVSKARQGVVVIQQDVFSLKKKLPAVRTIQGAKDMQERGFTDPGRNGSNGQGPRH